MDNNSSDNMVEKALIAGRGEKNNRTENLD